MTRRPRATHAATLARRQDSGASVSTNDWGEPVPDTADGDRYSDLASDVPIAYEAPTRYVRGDTGETVEQPATATLWTVEPKPGDRLDIDGVGEATVTSVDPVEVRRREDVIAYECELEGPQ